MRIGDRGHLVLHFFLLALALTPASAIADPDPRPFFDRLREARALAAKGELQAARLEFQSLDLETHGHPSAIWSLAQIAARLGEPDEAIQLLGDYAQMGLARSARRDTAFAALAGYTPFERVARALEENAGSIPDSSRRRSRAPFRSLDDPGLLPEDLARDPRSGVTYVSSVHRRKVVAIARDGSMRDFVRPAQGGMWGIYGLALEPARDLLWGSTAATPTDERHDPADSGRTAVVAWDLRTGEERLKVELPRDGRAHLLGDIALGADGTLYASDTVGGGLYRLRPGADSLEVIIPPGTLASPQDIVEVEPGRRLLVADYPQGLLLVDIEGRSARPVRKGRGLALTGIDGMGRMGSDMGRFIWLVQNGMRPARILMLTYHPDTTDTGTRTEVKHHVLDQFETSVGETSHAIAEGRELLLIGNSGWERVDDGGVLVTDRNSNPPFLFWVRRGR